MVASMNPYRDVSLRYDSLIQMVEFRYGARAQASILVLYDHLIALRSILAIDPDAHVVRSRISNISNSISERYRKHGFEPVYDHPTAIVGRDPVVIEFQRDIFEAKYRSVVDIVQAETVELVKPDISFLKPGRPYMFVIDEDGRLLVWTRDFAFEELVFGRNRATVNGVPVGHPMLVPQRLRAIAAGEIVFIGSQTPQAAIVNNKSGHFRFPPSCRQVILDKCEEVLALSAEQVDIFIVGGIDDHHVHRSGRVATKESREGVS
ncbi:hypothetical protein ACQP26_19690 [Micromonospora sp. CA-248089]|uniref:hypothetical protein n=1 Tax=Micromonospora sp. CA-248089 TaxID=3239960 RepID=UPI003D9484CC